MDKASVDMEACFRETESASVEGRPYSPPKCDPYALKHCYIDREGSDLVPVPQDAEAGNRAPPSLENCLSDSCSGLDGFEDEDAGRVLGTLGGRLPDCLTDYVSRVKECERRPWH